MSDFAQKRDVTDPATVAAFARIVENPERLRLLLVLTVADIRAVGPGVWNGWKGQLLRELYARHRGGVPRRPRSATPAGAWRAAGRRRSAYDGPRRPGRRRSGGRAPGPPRWRTPISPPSAREDSRPRQPGPPRPRPRAARRPRREIRADRNAAEMAVAARDRQGLFADLAAGDSPASGGNVVGAQGLHLDARAEALDVFLCRTPPAALRPRQPQVAGAAGRGAGRAPAAASRRRWRPRSAPTSAAPPPSRSPRR